MKSSDFPVDSKHIRHIKKEFDYSVAMVCLYMCVRLSRKFVFFPELVSSDLAAGC